MFPKYIPWRLVSKLKCITKNWKSLFKCPEYLKSDFSSHSINMHCFLKHTQDVSKLVSVKEEELFSGFPTRNCKPSMSMIIFCLNVIKTYSLTYYALLGLVLLLIYSFFSLQGWATTHYEGLQFLGHDYREFKTGTSELCQEMCTKDPHCHFYTYVPPTYHDEKIR